MGLINDIHASDVTMLSNEFDKKRSFFAGFPFLSQTRYTVLCWCSVASDSLQPHSSCIRFSLKWVAVPSSMDLLGIRPGSTYQMFLMSYPADSTTPVALVTTTLYLFGCVHQITTLVEITDNKFTCI